MYINPILVGVLGTIIVETLLMTIFVIVSVKNGRDKQNEDSNDKSNE